VGGGVGALDAAVRSWPRPLPPTPSLKGRGRSWRSSWPGPGVVAPHGELLMLWLVLGGLILFAFWGGLRAFERASVTSIKSLVAWIAALAGISLALLLILTGRGGIAIGALVMFGPMIWNRWRAAHPRMGQGAGSQSGGRQGGGSGGQGSGAAGQGGPARGSTAMTREEAYQVLGLKPGASEDDVRAAHRRLMRASHPDSGGSDWLASRINQARDILLGG
jgi:DnaJ family protein C protein 19